MMSSNLKQGVAFFLIKPVHRSIPVMLLLVLAFFPIRADNPHLHGLQGKKYVPGEILVKFKPGISKRRQNSVHKQTGGNILRYFRSIRVSHIKIKNARSMNEILAAYRSNPSVEYAEPNYIRRASATPNDPSFNQLWGHRNDGSTVITDPMNLNEIYSANNPGTAGKDMNLIRAWDRSTDCRSIVIAVLDSGVNYNHQDLAANMWDGSASCKDENGAEIAGGCPKHGYDFVGPDEQNSGDSDNDPMDFSGHGTHVAGIIGAVGNNGIGAAGVCWSANIMAVRILNSTGFGTVADEVAGINFAVQNGAKIINMSLGGSAYSYAEYAAIKSAQESGVLVVTAAGNEGVSLTGNNSYPCEHSLNNIVCVGAVDQSYNRASFSNYDANLVHIAAPGVNILSAVPGIMTTITEDFSAGWVGAAAGDWGVVTGSSLYCSDSSSYNILANPSTYCDSLALYDTGTDQIYKQFSINSQSDVVTLTILGITDNLETGDTFKAYSDTDTSPWDQTPFFTQGSTGIFYNGYLLSKCAGSPSCTIGFELSEDGSIGGYGILIYPLELNTIDLNDTNRYDVYNGTSMAAPQVAGVAALVWHYNPAYIYTDVIESLYGGADRETGLTGFFSEGRVADAEGSITYIGKPINVLTTIP